MLFRLMYDDDLAQAAYLIGCQKTREAIVIDPERDVQRYIDLAAEHGLTITDVAETHIHADFLSGARELSDRTQAHVHVSGEGGPDWQSRWVGNYPSTQHRDGDRFSVGGIEFTVIYSPGHTPEHISYLVRDLGAGAEEPLGIATGDFVFVGDLGRPDLLETAAGKDGAARPSAEQLATSAEAFLAMPDYLQVWPAHGSGSACGKALGAVPQSTVGYERRTNRTLGLASRREEFIADILDGQPEPPGYFARMKAWNRDGVPLLHEVPRPTLCSPSDIDDAMRVIDVRSNADFSACHLPGSIWSRLGTGFLMSVGSYIEPEERIAIVAEEKDRDRIVRNLIRIGLDRIECVVDPATITEGATMPEVTSEELMKILEQDNSTRILDVRRRSEWELGHAESAVNIAHTRLIDRIEEVPEDGPIYVHCLGGTRSSMAVSELRRRGFDAINIAGGFAAMRRAGLESLTEKSAC